MAAAARTAAEMELNMEEIYEDMDMDFSLDEAHEELRRDTIPEELYEGVDMDFDFEKEFEYEYHLLRKNMDTGGGVTWIICTGEIPKHGIPC